MCYEKKKYDSKTNYLVGFFFYLFLGIIIISIIFFGPEYFIMRFFDFEEVKWFEIIFLILKLFDILLIGPLFFIPAFRMLLGYLKGKKEIRKQEKDIKLENPYVYYRDLPNNFGIGICTLLIDSEIENEKDIVATILDLCAKGYLRLVKNDETYQITVLKQIDNSLLSNEKYILELILNNNLKNIDYQAWYQYCLHDGIQLGIYKNSNIVVSNELVNRDFGNDKLINKVAVIALIIALLLGTISYITKFHINHLKIFFADINTNYFSSSFLIAIITFSIIFFGFTMIYSIYIMGKKAQDFGKQYKEMSYKHTLSNQLIRTKLGEEETRKLYAFRNFIKDFGAFAHKAPEQIVLWDRYLSYAQLFGLTKEIMDSGYSKLVKNNSFHIDKIENITLNNITI